MAPNVQFFTAVTMFLGDDTVWEVTVRIPGFDSAAKAEAFAMRCSIQRKGTKLLCFRPDGTCARTLHDRHVTVRRLTAAAQNLLATAPAGSVVIDCETDLEPVTVALADFAITPGLSGAFESVAYGVEEAISP